MVATPEIVIQLWTRDWIIYPLVIWHSHGKSLINGNNYQRVILLCFSLTKVLAPSFLDLQHFEATRLSQREVAMARKSGSPKPLSSLHSGSRKHIHIYIYIVNINLKFSNLKLEPNWIHVYITYIYYMISTAFFKIRLRVKICQCINQNLWGNSGGYP